MTDTSLDKTLLTPWWHHVAVMAAYAGTYEILSSFGTNYWILTTGLRLTCLLLVPRRFWAALAIGELIDIATTTLPKAALYGIEWETAVLIPHMIFCMPLIVLMQQRMPLFRRDGQINTSALLVASLLFALALTLRGSIAMSALSMQDGSPNMLLTGRVIFEWVLGAYLGALAITPCVLAIRERLLSQKVPLTWSALMRGSLFRDVLVFQLPIALAMVLAANYLVEWQGLTYFRTALVFPVVVLSVRYGWHGTAVSGMISALFLSATSLDTRDPSLIPTEILLALAISSWLIWTQKLTPRLWSYRMAGASAWVALLALIPMRSIRHAFSPQYLGVDGMRYDVHGQLIGGGHA
ncbi:MAG: hypothetical protein GAK28_01262 [Luteibacter sp.]|uniref:MASE1 domain-containing protein n=1 Tax=Luteibacter sp. TaxID=1886636 RepID=UPI001385E70A|nr:MASE1 domain-containing protein [Luteibacter sp.]KAF1008281.1 MAG: hypothetical protein GAK28_01262 [Luteibacter sp.]